MTLPNTARVLGFDDRNVHIDDLKCVLNPTQAADLTRVLEMTPEDLRLDVACVWARITKHRAFVLAGLATDEESGGNSSWYRWMRGHSKMPLGAAFRVARIFGVPADILLIHYSRCFKPPTQTNVTWEEEA